MKRIRRGEIDKFSFKLFFIFCQKDTDQTKHIMNINTRCLSLLYDSKRGANHALHVDDLWLWGPRIVGVSLLSDSFFTFFEPQNEVYVRVRLPRRSAYLINGTVRTQWQHGILAEDILKPRLAITFRELTEELAESALGREALQRARMVAEKARRRAIGMDRRWPWRVGSQDFLSCRTCFRAITGCDARSRGAGAQ